MFSFYSMPALLMLVFTTAVHGKNCALRIAGNDMMQYDKKVLQVDNSCQQVTVTLTHSGQLPKAAMGHNWVLTKAADKEATVAAGVTAGPQHGYLLKGDARIIAATGMIGGKEQTSVTFPTSKLKVSEKYVFFCTFPGHVGLMAGDFIFTAAAKSASKAKPAAKSAGQDKSTNTATPEGKAKSTKKATSSSATPAKK